MPEAGAYDDREYYRDESFVEAPKPPKLFDPTYIIPRLLFRWHWILIGLVLGLAWGFISIKLATPMHRANAIVKVVENTAAKASEEIANIDLRSKEAVDNVRETFEVTALFMAVASDPGVYNMPNLRPPPAKTLASLFQGDDAANQAEVQPYTTEGLANAIRSWTKVSGQKNSRRINITVIHPDAAVTAKIANKIVEKHSKLRTDRISRGSSSVINNLKDDLDVANQQIVEFTRQKSIYNNALEADKDFRESKKEVSELEVEYREAHPKMKSAMERSDLRRKTLVNELIVILNNPTENDQWESQRSRYSDLSDTRIFEALRSEVRGRVSGLESSIANTGERRDALQTKISELETQTENVEAEVERVEDAKVPKGPFSPNRNKLLTKGAVFGLGFGLLLAFIFQLFDNKISSVAEVETAYKLPVLSAIRKLPDEATMEAEKAALTTLPLSFSQVHPNLAVTGWASDPVYSEMFRVLRASVSLLGDASERNVTLVSSSIPGEGKTFVAANLALAFAKQGTKTLLIDFDLRKPAVHKIFGQPRHGFQGITNVLNGTAGLGDVIATFEGFTNLSVIFSGEKSRTPGELLEPGKLYSIIEAYAGNFDHVVIDSAPLLPVPDTRILAPLAHNFCLVVRADHTPRRATYSALELLAADGMQPSGVVLNDFTEKRLQAGKYGYGYGYGEYGETEEEEEEIIH